MLLLYIARIYLAFSIVQETVIQTENKNFDRDYFTLTLLKYKRSKGDNKFIFNKILY